MENKVAFITGGTKGIGRAIAQSLIEMGMRVFICARNSQELNTNINELNNGQSENTRAAGALCDVRSFEQIAAAFEECEQQFGGIDILVNNAGIGIFKPVEELSPEEFRSVLETNLFGVFYACHTAIPIMKRRGGGYIINISSLAGANAHPQMAAYNASKFGLNGFSEALMQEVRHDNIKVSYIMPGSVNTEFGGEDVSPEKSWQLQPEDISQVVVNLLNMNERALPSRIEIRPSRPPKK